MKSVRASVVIPTSNRIGDVQRALSSVERQAFRDFEVWIVDDGSRDETAVHLQPDRLRAQYPDLPSFHVLRNDRSRGAAAARNQAIDRTHGEYIAFLDDDDEWLPDYLGKQVANLDRHRAAAASWAAHVEVDSRGRLHRPDTRPLFSYDDTLLRLLTESFIHTMSVVVCKKASLERVGTLEESLAVVHDLDLYARLLMAGETIVPLGGAPLVRRRIPGGLVTRYREWYAEERTVLEQVFRQHPDSARTASRIRAHRALLFARVAGRHRDFAFAFERLQEAIREAPVRSLQIMLMRFSRNLLSAVSRSGSGYGLNSKESS